MIEHAPWVGSRYAAEGIDGQRIAILGYSAWTPDDHEQYTVDSVRNVVSGAWKNVGFFNAIAGYFGRPVADFYARVALFEFVPCSVGGGDQRYAVATPEQAETGRSRVLRIVRDHGVEKLFVFSAKALKDMPPTLEAASGSLPRLNGTAFKYGHYAREDGSRTVVVGLRHPQYAPGDLMRRAVAEAMSLST